MICPKCGLEYQEGFNICAYCGIPLVKGQAQYCPSCGAAIVPNTGRCVKCKVLLTSDGQIVESVENVPILGKDGNEICSIHCPQTWSHFTPYLRTTKKWTDPQSVIVWAWHQAFETNTFYQEHNINKFGLDSPASLCVVCKTQSVKPVWANRLFKSGVTGIQCENPNCKMYLVTVPWQMLLHIKEVPTQYIPKGFYVRRPNDSNFSFVMQPPCFVIKSIAKMVKELTLSEEEQLKETSTRLRSDMLERQQRVQQQVAKMREATASEVLAFTVCSACGFTLRAIKNEANNNLSTGSVTSGLICHNPKCAFYLKFIPVNRVPELTNFAFIPQMTLATENYLKEYPEERRK